MKDTIVSLTGFGLLLVLAWTLRWTPGDLVWGIWISGLALAVVGFLVFSAAQVRHSMIWALSLAGVLMKAVFLGWVLYFFYNIYGGILDLGFPLRPDPGRIYIGKLTWKHVRPFEFGPSLLYAMKAYAPMLAVSVLMRIPLYVKVLRDPDLFRNTSGVGNVVNLRLHFTVMGLVFLQMLTAEHLDNFQYLYSVFILVVSYFPWSVLSKRPLAAPAGK